MSTKTKLLRELEQGPKTEKQLRATTHTDPKKLLKALGELEKEKRVVLHHGLVALYGSSPEADSVEAEIVKLAPTFGFARPLDGSADIFLPGHVLEGALLHDVVLVVLSSRPRVAGSREGEGMTVLRPYDRFVGVVERQEGKLVFVPDSMPYMTIAIKPGADGGAKPGEKVAVQVLERGGRQWRAVAGVVRRFGLANAARQCAKAILFDKGIERAFPDAVKQEGKAAAARRIGKEELALRLDLRKETIFTIDSLHTKDIDDAISAKTTENGYEVGVHIADVSYYVRPGSELDNEAFRRGTSVYYADTVVPMLPRSLSNGICSLNEREDRLALSCLLRLDEQGKLLGYHFVKTVIQSRIKGVYEEINQIYAGTADPQVVEKYKVVAQELSVMREVYHKLAKLRAARGSLEIESDEPVLVVDGEGCCADVQKRIRGETERLIEEFMLLANTAAAQYSRVSSLPFIYRVHPAPSGEKGDILRGILEEAGVPYRFAQAIPTQAELAEVLDSTRETDKAILVHGAVLRCMEKAVYAPVQSAHFGLSLQDYAHFTSPIRRYPDLAVHRILSAALAGEKREEMEKKYRQFSQSAAAQSSAREQAAVAAERSCDDCYKAEYMKQFVGAQFEGIVSSVTDFGLYVLLPNTVEGLVLSSSLSENRLRLHAGVSLTDPVTSRRYSIGQKAMVRVLSADVSTGKINFALLGTGGEA